MATRGLVFSGARARFLIEGVKVALATSVNYSEETQHDPVEVLDQLEVEEYVPVAHRVTLSAAMVRVVTQPIKLRDGVRIMARPEDAFTAPELTATIEDSVTGQVVANIQRVKCTRATHNVGARGIVATDCEFVAIRIKDESEIT